MLSGDSRFGSTILGFRQMHWNVAWYTVKDGIAITKFFIAKLPTIAVSAVRSFMSHDRGLWENSDRTMPLANKKGSGGHKVAVKPTLTRTVLVLFVVPKSFFFGRLALFGFRSVVGRDFFGFFLTPNWPKRNLRQIIWSSLASGAKGGVNVLIAH